MARQRFKVCIYSRTWKRNGKKCKAWGVRYRIGDKYLSRIVGPEQDDAVVEAGRLKDDHERRVRGVAEEKPFSELVPLYLKDKEKQEKDVETIGLRVRNLSRHFSEMILEDITAEAVDKYVDHRRGEVSNATINRELAVLRNMLKLAVRKWRWLRQEPYLELLPEGDGRDRELSEAEEREILPHLNSAFRDLFQAALNTGMRQGELLRITWPQVNLTTRLIDFPPTKRGRKRLMPINESLYYILARRKADPKRSERVFTKADGTPWGKAGVKYHVDKAMAASGVKAFVFHDLRHTFSSRLNRQGVSKVYVQELLGHKTSKTTDLYLHAQVDDLRAAVGTLGKDWTQTEHGHELNSEKPRKVLS